MLWVTTLGKIEHNGMLTTRRTAPIKNALPRDRRGVCCVKYLCSASLICGRGQRNKFMSRSEPNSYS